MSTIEPVVPSKPWWESTTANSLVAAAVGLLNILIPVLLPKLTSIDVSNTVQAVWTAAGGVLNAVGIVGALIGRLRSDGAKLTLTRRSPTLTELS